MRTFTTTRRSLISAHNNCGCTVQPFGQIRDNGPGISLSPTASFKVSLIANWHQNRLEVLGSAHSKPNDKCFDSLGRSSQPRDEVCRGPRPPLAKVVQPQSRNLFLLDSAGSKPAKTRFLLSFTHAIVQTFTPSHGWFRRRFI
jgi:hypothetical protein